MNVEAREPGDVERLKALIRRERRAAQRDRFRMVLRAIEGDEKLDIVRDLGVAKSTVEKWVYAYRDGGINALFPKKRPGDARPAEAHPRAGGGLPAAHAGRAAATPTRRSASS